MKPTGPAIAQPDSRHKNWNHSGAVLCVIDVGKESLSSPITLWTSQEMPCSAPSGWKSTLPLDRGSCPSDGAASNGAVNPFALQHDRFQFHGLAKH